MSLWRRKESEIYVYKENVNGEMVVLLGEVRRQHVVEYAICQLSKEIPNNEMSRASHKCTTQQL